MEFNEEKKRFSRRLEPFKSYLPTLEQTINKLFYSRLTLPETSGTTMAGLGYQCAATFDEICFVCTNGYGLAGSKLLRGLYERVVTAAYFAREPVAAEKFIRSFDVDFGKLVHRNQEFIATHGEDPKIILPPEVLQKVEDNYKLAKDEEERCEKCGALRGRIDVVSMARSAVPDLVPYLGLAYLEPTLHVHPTWYSIVASVGVIRKGENHKEFDPRPEGDCALMTLQLAHLVMLYAAETQNAYFNLQLETEIAERRKEYQRIWEAVAAIH